MSNKQAHCRVFHSKISRCTSLLPKCFQLTPDCTLLHTTITTTTNFANKLHSLLTGDRNKYTLKSCSHPLYTPPPPPIPHSSTSSAVATMSASNVEEAKFTDEQYATINQSTAGHFDPRVFVNCLRTYSMHILMRRHVS